MTADLPRLIALVTEELHGLPPVAQDYEAMRLYWRAAEAILDRLAATEGAKVGSSAGATTLLLAGVRASSTGGAVGLLLNWRRGAEKRLAGGAA